MRDIDITSPGRAVTVKELAAENRRLRLQVDRLQAESAAMRERAEKAEGQVERLKLAINCDCDNGMIFEKDYDGIFTGEYEDCPVCADIWDEFLVIEPEEK